VGWLAAIEPDLPHGEVGRHRTVRCCGPTDWVRGNKHHQHYDHRMPGSESCIFALGACRTAADAADVADACNSVCVVFGQAARAESDYYAFLLTSTHESTFFCSIILAFGLSRLLAARYFILLVVGDKYQNTGVTALPHTVSHVCLPSRPTGGWRRGSFGIRLDTLGGHRGARTPTYIRTLASQTVRTVIGTDGCTLVCVTTLSVCG